MFIGTVLAALAVGFLGGLLTFKRSLRWCRRCGGHLQCLACLRQAQRLSQVGHHRHLSSSQTP
jgi:hypothetical protein